MLAHGLAILVYRVKSVHVVWKHCNHCHYLVQQTIFFFWISDKVGCSLAQWEGKQSHATWVKGSSLGLSPICSPFLSLSFSCISCLFLFTIQYRQKMPPPKKIWQSAVITCHEWFMWNSVRYSAYMLGMLPKKITFFAEQKWAFLSQGRYSPTTTADRTATSKVLP